ncbi:hypothetical protein K8B33_00260 [Alcanivorax sp. JB21]|uniref:hypothetical protein n=1 Tax=Alcanivorax limicola TaxID=2874102 RepID=UPI001CC09341|nr:hypothetical protein [Alcanivorax limicola]MBZ2187516.1 hypothetical protein [Alcanivorax limicola]
MRHFSTLGILLGTLATLLFGNLVFAEERDTGSSNRAGVGTNIIGSQEAPTVLNVVPWKEREVKLERKDPTSSLLDRVLEPLDQDVLLREIEYHQRLNASSGQ